MVFFLLAAFIWMATLSLEHRTKCLGEINAALKESEERYRSLLEISPDLVVLTDPSGKIMVVNQAGLTLFGFTSASEVVGKSVFEFIAPEDQQRASAAFGRMVEYGAATKVEYRAQNREGAAFFIELSASVLRDPNGQPQGVLSVGRDVTLRKKMEQALLAEKDEAYRVLVNNSAQGLILSQHGRIVLANQAIADCFGLALEEISALSEEQIFAFVHPDDRAMALANQRNRLAGGNSPKRYEVRFVSKSGEIHWLEVSPTTITLNGAPASQITTIEITERRQAEKALRESEERYRSLAESAEDMIFIISPEDRLEYMNRFAAQLLGLTPEEAVGLPRSHFFSAAVNQKQQHDIRAVLTSGKPLFLENSTLFPTGEKWLSTRLVPIKDESGNAKAILGISRDISERKQTEEALRESEKRYRDLFENASLAIFQTGLDGKIIAVNPEFVRMFGYLSADDFLAKIKDASQVFADPQRRAEIIRLRAKNPALNHFESLYRRKDGSTFLGRLTLKSITDHIDQTLFFEGFIEEITAQKHTEIS